MSQEQPETVILLPQALELEEAVLGAMLVDRSAIEETIEVLTTKVFYKREHQLIFNAIREVYIESERVDMLTISQYLKAKGDHEKAGGDLKIIELTQKVATGAHVDFHSKILLQKFIQREIIAVSNDLNRKAYEEGVDALELIDKAYNKLNALSDSTIKPREVSFGSVLEEVRDKALKIYRNEITPGLPTPIALLTSVSGGWRNGELIILAARPGMGKTAFALKSALQTAKNNIPTAFFCLEMSKETLVSRMVSMETRIPIKNFNKDGLSPEDDAIFVQHQRVLESLPIEVDDTADLSIEQFQIKAKRLKNKKGIKIIFVDYLQLMSSKGSGNREQEISKISRGLKKVAKELELPVIALSQLSRSVETRGGSKRPLLSDLRESGAIEQDADVVGFLYRPEYYGFTEWDDDDDYGPCAGQAECIIAKNRNGSLSRVRMKFEGEYTLFSDLQSDVEREQERETVREIPPEESPQFIQGIDPKDAF